MKNKSCLKKCIIIFFESTKIVTSHNYLCSDVLNVYWSVTGVRCRCTRGPAPGGVSIEPRSPSAPLSGLPLYYDTLPSITAFRASVTTLYDPYPSVPLTRGHMNDTSPPWYRGTTKHYTLYYSRGHIEFILLKKYFISPARKML